MPQRDLLVESAQDLESAIAELEAEWDRLDSTGRDTSEISERLGELRADLEALAVVNRRRETVLAVIR